MPTISIKIANIDQIRRAFQKAPALTAKKIDQAVKKSALKIQADSMKRTPVLTGRLRASHQTTFGPLRATIQPTADYAIYVHQGTRYMKARPFLFDAVKSDESTVQKFFTDAVQEVFDEIARGTK